MPYTVIVPLESADPWRPTGDEQRGAHGLFFQLLKTADYPTTPVHEAHVKPFTQALLTDDLGCFWRVTLLDEGLCDPFLTGLQRMGVQQRLMGRPIGLGSAEVQHVPYADLIAAEPRYAHRIRLLTATTIKRQAHQHPLPDAGNYWRSWWQRWQAFAPPDCLINAAVGDIAAAHLVIADFRVQAQRVTLTDGRKQPAHFVGCTGRVRFHTLQRGKLSEAWWRHLTTLANFAPFCGTGSKTAQGFGQTRLRL